MLKTSSAVLSLLLTTPLPLAGQARATRVVVRAVSRDAKVIQNRVGGARITIREAATGRILAQGLQKGHSGDTAKIMLEPRRRGQTVYGTPSAASFTATLMLERPTVVEITAEGPLKYPQAIQRASKTMLLVPGQDVLGEGVLLEIHGFIVQLLTPQRHYRVGQDVEVKSQVHMT